MNHSAKRCLEGLLERINDVCDELRGNFGQGQAHGLGQTFGVFLCAGQAPFIGFLKADAGWPVVSAVIGEYRGDGDRSKPLISGILFVKFINGAG